MDMPVKHSTPLKKFKKLHKQLFVGRYTEKRYVESLKDYRDVISIHRDDHIIPHLRELQKYLLQEACDRWVGITNDIQDRYSGGFLLWVQMNNVPVVGKHWFQIRSVKFEDKEIRLQVQHVRAYEVDDGSFIRNNLDSPTFNLHEIFTFNNFCYTIKFSTALFMTLVTLAIETVKYIAEYSIQISYALQGIIHALTPTFLGIIDLLTKCIGGLYWLIYVLFKSNPTTRPIDGSSRALQYYQDSSRTSQSKSRVLPITMGTRAQRIDTSNIWKSYDKTQNFKSNSMMDFNNSS